MFVVQRVDLIEHSLQIIGHSLPASESAAFMRVDSSTAISNDSDSSPGCIFQAIPLCRKNNKTDDEG